MVRVIQSSGFNIRFDCVLARRPDDFPISSSLGVCLTSRIRPERQDRFGIPAPNGCLARGVTSLDAGPARANATSQFHHTVKRTTSLRIRGVTASEKCMSTLFVNLETQSNPYQLGNTGRGQWTGPVLVQFMDLRISVVVPSTTSEILCPPSWTTIQH